MTRLAGDALAYGKFDRAVMLVHTSIIVLLVTLATWHLVVAVLLLILNDKIDAGNPLVFQGVFELLSTVVIGREFKRSLLIVSGGQDSVVRVRSIILIGMLATVRKFIVLDLANIDTPGLFAVSAVILALGIVQ